MPLAIARARIERCVGLFCLGAPPPKNELHPPAPAQLILLAGQRGAGKSHLLPTLAALLGRRAIELDREIEAREGMPIRALFALGEARFRAAERAAFEALAASARAHDGAVVALGGGFLQHHAPLLAGHWPVLIPISFESYRERLLCDTERPRLLPHLPLEEELLRVFQQREVLHAALPLHSLSELLALAPRLVPIRPARVVTLPPLLGQEEALIFAKRARAMGADLLELRTDLHPEDALKAAPLAGEIELLAAERGAPPPREWLDEALLLDLPSEHFERGAAPAIGNAPGRPSLIVSWHAATPLSTDDALSYWRSLALPAQALVKHVEPLGSARNGERLFETRRQLSELTDPRRVTALATGPEALPFRALLAPENALDYLALDPASLSAPGQRLLPDAAREERRPRTKRRLGILGNPVTASLSPRLHPWPFDRIELPPDVDLGELLAALHSHYAGFAVTSPFKSRAAEAARTSLPVVNTLLRTEEGWEGFNTDLDGATHCLAKLRAQNGITILGAGGAAASLRAAAELAGMTQQTLRRSDLCGEHAPLTGDLFWTWPAQVAPPAGLRFERARVALIAYGAPARAIAQEVAARGGEPILLGATWLIAQARHQRRLFAATLGGHPP